MIGFEYEGSVNYISRIDDFQEYMKPEVYEAMREAFENGCDGVGGFRKKYEEIKSDYDDLEYECESLKDEIDGAEDRLAECEEERDNLDEKYKSLKHQIEKLINDIYMEYIKPDDIVPALEKMI
jgi:archaellum component FlaC